MHRRQFLSSASSLLAAGLAAPLLTRAELAKDNAFRKNIGLQLYTLRKELEKDTEGTLKAGFHSKTEKMLKVCKDLGLAVNSTHFDWDCLVNPATEDLADFKTTVEKAKAAGISHLVVPYLVDKDRSNLDGFKKVAERLNKGSVITKAAGIQLSYHNHNWEFKPLEGGKSGYDVFISEFGPDVQFELDLFWVKLGGIEPLELMKKLSGRISQLHLKDVKADVKMPEFGSVAPDVFQELGDGIIAWEPVLAAAAAAGVKHCHVEQDQSPDALASVKQSISYLGKI
jgi:sugar phosphate isomerase/epimerase